MSPLAQPAAERPEVAVVRHPIADLRNNAPGVSLAGAYRAALEWADDAGRAISWPASHSVRA